MNFNLLIVIIIIIIALMAIFNLLNESFVVVVPLPISSPLHTPSQLVAALEE